MDKELEQIITTASAAADAAGEVARKWFRNPPPIEGKDAPSPVVTEADRASEEAMRAVIRAAHPDHCILGEELAAENAGSRVQWVLDPIDGTIAFLAGKPTFVSLIGVTIDAVPAVGMIDQTIVGDRWIGCAGHGATLNGEATETSARTSLGKAILGTTTPDMFEGVEDKAWFYRIAEQCMVTSFGGDGYAYGLLASGHIDLIMESGLAWHDAAALIPIITEAGGVVSDFDGNPLLPEQENYDVLAVANRDLHQQILELKND